MLRLDSGPYTLRQLLVMTRAYRREAWQHTAAIAAILINVNRKAGARAVTPEELNPYAKDEKQYEKPIGYIRAGKLGKMIARNRDT